MKTKEIENEVNKLESILAPCINKIYDNINLEEIYTWPIEINNDIFSKSERDNLSNDNMFINNVNLKHIINEKLKDDNFNKKDLYKWIIKWGKIRKFEQYDNVDKFLDKLKENINLFPNTIPSFSKIASFKYLNKYFIYDAHVSYVLNWLLLKNNYNDDIKYFPIKNSENRDISRKYNMDTILTLTNKKIEYYDNKTFYFLYCKLIQSITKNNEKFNEPFYLEMMLFSILKNVIDEIKDKVKISIDK